MSASETAAMPAARGTVLPYAATIFLSAFLLFLVQPIIAKQILPWFGGSSAVWTTAWCSSRRTLLAGLRLCRCCAAARCRAAQTLLHVGLLGVSLLCCRSSLRRMEAARRRGTDRAHPAAARSRPSACRISCCRRPRRCCRRGTGGASTRSCRIACSRSRILRRCWRCSAFRCCSSRGSTCRQLGWIWSIAVRGVRADLCRRPHGSRCAPPATVRGRRRQLRRRSPRRGRRRRRSCAGSRSRRWAR